MGEELISSLLLMKERTEYSYLINGYPYGVIAFGAMKHIDHKSHCRLSDRKADLTGSLVRMKESSNRHNKPDLMDHPLFEQLVESYDSAT